MMDQQSACFERRGGSRTAATSKMERFVIIVNGFQPLTITTKRSILDVAAVLDPPLERAPILYLNPLQQYLEIVSKLAATLTYKRSILSPSKKKEKSNFKQFLVCFPIIYLSVKNVLIKSYSI